MLSVPLEDQFEQMLNARYLELEGFGMMTESFDDETVIPRFLERVPACAAKLAGYSQERNVALLDAVDEFLDKAANEPR
jgi:hypothetical protein